MKSRSLSPFLVSFALAGAAVLSPRLSGQTALAADLSSCRTLPVDASGAFVGGPSPAPVAAAAPLRVTTSTAPARTYTLTADELQATLASQIAAHYAPEGDLQIDLLSNWVPPAPSKDPIVATIVEYPSRLLSSLVVRVHIEGVDASRAETAVALRAQLWRNAFATREPVGRNDVVSLAVLEKRRVDALRESEALYAISEPANMVFTRGVPAGRLLNWRDVARRALVRKGDFIEVVAEDGQLSVSMKGVALQSGGKGDTIFVRNPESMKEIAALVVAENRAEVRF